MKFLRKTADSLCGMVAFILSILLVLVLLILPMTLAGSAAVEPEMLHEMILAVVQPELFGEEEGSVMDQLLQTDTAKEFLKLYLDDLFHQLEGGHSRLDTWAVMSVVENNMDELMPLCRKLVMEAYPEEDAIPEDVLRMFVLMTVQQYAEMILQKLPSFEKLGLKAVPKVELSALPTEELLSLWILDPAVLDRLVTSDIRIEDLLAVANQLLILLKDGLALRILIHLALALSLLILLLRLGGGMRGFCWLGWSYLLAGALAAGCTACVNFGVKALVAGTELEPVFAVANPVIDKMLVFGCVILGTGILLFVIASIGDKILAAIRRHRQKRKAVS